jgi:hypothetical protein
LLLLLLAAVTAPPPAAAQSSDALIDSLQYRAFRYFWYEANPDLGLVKDRDTPGSPCSIAATGFGLTGICIGIDHGWITRAEGSQRVLNALNTFWSWPQGTQTSGTIGYKGLFYHFLDMNTGVRTWTSELSTIDTALLLAGILDARQYFNQNNPTENQIRALADSINRRVDWNWTKNGSFWIKMGWKPESAFSEFGNWVGYNEATIMEILALGSPTFAVDTTTYVAWSNQYPGKWATYYGQTYLPFAPLFGHQYSHCWIDFRNRPDAFMRTKGIDYFENSRRATYAARAYCIANPFAWPGYSDSLWGLTASDDPQVGYQAHGGPPSTNDNGTITPTGAISSIAFAPEIVIPFIHKMWNTYKTQLWGPYGWNDAFSPRFNWFGQDALGIDQGPILIMIENYRNGSVWNRFMTNPEILTGLFRAGFRHNGVGVGDVEVAAGLAILSAAPNPFVARSNVRFSLERAGRVRLSVYDVRGREVARPFAGMKDAGTHDVAVDLSAHPAGVYLLRLESEGGGAAERKIVRAP